MKKFMDWLEKSFAPRLQKVAELTWILVIKDSLSQLLPFILAGSLFCCLAILNDYFPSLPNFWTAYNWTMNKISLMVAALIPFNYCEMKNYRKQRIIAAISGLILFMIFAEPQIVIDGQNGTFGQNHSTYGAGGMFTAIFAGVIAGLIFGFFSKFSFFKEDSAIPDFVQQWFDSLLPICIVILGGLTLTDILGIDINAVITSTLMPLQNFCNTWYGMTFIMFLTCFIYSMGISTWVMTPVVQPVKLMGIAANLALVAAGTATVANLNIFTDTFMFTTYMWIGGTGATMSLCLLMAFRAKSNELRALGRAALGPSVFNINEPIVFGAVAWNPILMLPMWIEGIVLPLYCWIFSKVIPFAPIPRIQFDLWYCPFPIGTFIATQGSIRGIIFVFSVFLLSGLIWYPFFKTYDRMKVKAAEEAQAQAAQPAPAEESNA